MRKNLSEGCRDLYSYRKRTSNSYYVIKPEVWDLIFDISRPNPFVLTCGADANTFSCAECRNCEDIYAVKIKELGLPSAVI